MDINEASLLNNQRSTTIGRVINPNGGIKRLLFTILCFHLWLLAGCFNTIPKVQSSHSYSCKKIATGLITIDGNIDEECWKHAQALQFYDFQDGSQPALQASAKMLWDHNYIYVSYNVPNPDVMAFYGNRKRGHSRSNSKKRFSRYGENQIMNQDSLVEFFLDPDSDGANYIEFHINPINNIADLLLDYPYLYAYNPSHGGLNSRKILNLPLKKENNPDWYWNCEGFKSAVQVNGTLNYSDDIDNGWSVELAIPWKTLKPLMKDKGDLPIEKRKWRILLVNVYKKRGSRKGKFTSWPVMGILNCHLPERWGEIYFKK